MVENEREGAAGAETSDIGAVAAPGWDRRMSASRKRDAVLRLLRGESLEIVARELGVIAADLSGWPMCCRSIAAALPRQCGNMRYERLAELMRWMPPSSWFQQNHSGTFDAVGWGHPPHQFNHADRFDGSRIAGQLRRMLALALEGVDRKTAAQTCGMDRQTLRE